MQRKVTVYRRLLPVGLVLCGVWLSAPASNDAAAMTPRTTPLALPSTFAGELPCGDCTGQRIVLTLSDDSTYRLRRTYLGATDSADKAFYELGRWRWDRATDGPRIRLDGGGTQLYRVLSADRLQAAVATPAFTLTRQPQADAIAGPMRLRGMYSYMADAAVFRECHTGKRYPVSPGAAQGDTERAYLALTRDNPGAPLLASLQGRFEVQSVDPAAAPREHLVIERFERFWPGETCAREAPAEASLYDTYWRPVEIDGQPVAPAPQQREPHIVLAADGRRVSGSTGCNRISGGFEQDSEGLRFVALATTRMACPPPVAGIEARFLEALTATAALRIVGESLELSDATGQLRMRLEARYLH